MQRIRNAQVACSSQVTSSNEKSSEIRCFRGFIFVYKTTPLELQIQSYAKRKLSNGCFKPFESSVDNPVISIFICNNQPIANLNHSITLLSNTHIMRYDDNRLALFVELFENAHNFISSFCIKCARRLVCKDY